MTIQDLLREWGNHERPLIIIDEIRPSDDGQRGRQFCIYTAVLTTTKTAVQIAWSGARLRELLLHPKKQLRAFKGRQLFGSRSEPRHEPFRKLFFFGLGLCQATATLVTTNDILRADRGHLRGGINAELAPGENRPARIVRGPELLLMLNMIKQISNHWWAGVEQVEVLVDRSQQLGLDPRSRWMDEYSLEVFGPDHLNTAPGSGPSEFQCPSKFRIVSSSEEGLFADLLMLPDGAGYLRQKAGGHDIACDRVRAGESYWMKYENTEPFRAEAERRAARASARDLAPL